MAHASKQFVVFTGGEWSEQLHGRTDLEKAEAAGRKVRNFVISPLGRISRRKGLEYCGEALGECLAGDPRFQIPDWATLEVEAVIDPRADVYGALGPEELRSSPVIGPIWQVCNNIAYCDGPTVEGATMTHIEDRYLTRWVAKLEEGCVYYRRVGAGEDWTQVPTELIPQPSDTYTGLGFCFDANARPVFASQIGSNIKIWRWQAEVPISYTFPGTGPRLYFDGVLQRENSLWDVVCYFCWLGDLVATFQRENFLTNYTLFTSVDHYFTRVKVVERGLGDVSERLHIAAVGSGGLYGLFRTPLYNPWPFSVYEFGTQAVAVESIEYALIIVECGTYLEPATQAIAIDGIDYMAVTVAINQPTEPATQGIAIESISYPDVVVQLGSYTEGAEQGIAIEGIAYPVVSVNAGTYSEPATQAIAIDGINYATA